MGLPYISDIWNGFTTALQRLYNGIRTDLPFACDFESQVTMCAAPARVQNYNIFLKPAIVVANVVHGVG